MNSKKTMERSETPARTPDGHRIDIIRRENASLRRFQSGIIWLTAIFAGVYSLIFMARSVMPGHWWEGLISVGLIAYMLYVVDVNV